MYGTFVASASPTPGRKARIAILSMFTIVVCSMLALTSMFPATDASSYELRQRLAAQSAAAKPAAVPLHAAAADVDHLQAKWQKDEASLQADRAAMHKDEAAFAKDLQQVQYQVGLQRQVVTDDKNLQDVELSQLPRAEFEYHEAAAEAVVHAATHSVALLDAKQNEETAVEKEIRDQEQKLKSDLTVFREHKPVKLDINKEAAALGAAEKKLQQDEAHLNADISKVAKQIKVSKSTNAMLAADWTKTVNNLEEIKKVEAEVETKKQQISVVKSALSEDDEQPGTYEAATDSKAAAGIAGFAAAEVGGYHGAPTVFGAKKSPKAAKAVKQHLSEDEDEHLGTYEEATDSKAAAGIAGFAAAEVGGYHGAPTVFGAKKSPKVSKALSPAKTRLTSASLVKQGEYDVVQHSE